jgi:ankyrin repeat protein
VTRVEILIDAGANVNASNIEDSTPLLIALLCNEPGEDQRKIAQLLINAGADVNVANFYDGQTPLIWACENEEARLAEFFIEHGANVNASNKKEETPLLWACWNSDFNLAKLLVEHGADVNASNEDGETPLHWACHKNLTDLAQLLVKNGANVNAKNDDGNSALDLAKTNEIKQLLLAHGAKQPEDNTMGTLLLASASGNLDAVKNAVNNGADVNAKDEEGVTPLMQAKSAEIAQLLISNGANVNAKDNDGWTPLHWTCHKGYSEIAQLLINNGADINAKDNDGHTPLISACMYEHPQIAKLLIQYYKNEKDKSPLLWAYNNRLTQITKFLSGNDKAHYIGINAQDSFGDTPLIWACNKDLTEIVKLLLDAGAYVNIKNNDGKSALDLSRTYEIKLLLLTHGAK